MRKIEDIGIDIVDKRVHVLRKKNKFCHMQLACEKH